MFNHHSSVGCGEMKESKQSKASSTDENMVSSVRHAGSFKQINLFGLERQKADILPKIM